MFSIIVPSYNFDVVIVDDCSKEPVEVTQSYPFSVNVIRNETNQGAAESRNIGARYAQQAWLLFLDDDDRFAPNKCEMLAEVIAAHEDINFVYHPAKCEMVNEGFTYVTSPIEPQEISVERILLANKIGGMPMIGVKKDLFLKIGGLSTALRSLEDYDFLLKLLQEPSFKPYKINAPLTHCTFHTKRSSVSTDTTNTQKAIEYIRQHYVKTEAQARNFNINASYILAYPHIMNLSRKAAVYYFDIFKQTKSVKQLIIALVVLISPSLAINLKRFM